MIGQTYLERGRPVKVLAAWRGTSLCRHAPGEHAACDHVRFPNYKLDTVALCLRIEIKGSAPRNVLIQRDDGTLVVRPFRGLRKVQKGPAQ